MQENQPAPKDTVRNGVQIIDDLLEGSEAAPAVLGLEEKERPGSTSFPGSLILYAN
jgi:hypothetical protein